MIKISLLDTTIALDGFSAIFVGAAYIRMHIEPFLRMLPKSKI